MYKLPSGNHWSISEREEGALKKGMRWFAFWLLLLLMGAGQAEEGVVDAQQQKEDEEGVIEEECEEEVEEGEVGCSSLVNCGQCISHPGCVYCRDPDFLLQERSPDLVFLSIISFLISVHLIYRTICTHDELLVPLDHSMQTTTRCGTSEFFLLSNSSCSLFEDPQNYWQEVRNQVLPKIQTNLNILNVLSQGLTE